MLRLDNKIAIVTGAARGIGRAIANRLARSGSHVAIGDLHPEGAEKVAGEIRAAGRRALAVQADVSKSDEVQTMVQNTLRSFGCIDMLVNDKDRLHRRERGEPQHDPLFHLQSGHHMSHESPGKRSRDPWDKGELRGPPR